MSNEFATVVAKFAGNVEWKKSSGKPPCGVLNPLIIARIAANCAAPAGVLAEGWLLNEAQLLYSVVVNGTDTPPSVANSAGRPMKSGPAFPELILKFGWLNALFKSTLN